MTDTTLNDAPRTTLHSTRLVHFLLLITILIAFSLRIGSLTYQSLWRDEVDAIRFALAPLPDLIKTFTQPGFNGPLYFLMLRGWIDLAGQSEYAVRFPSLFFGVISIALIFVLGKRLFNRSIGLIAAILFTFSAYQVWYSQEAKMYTLISALALAAIYFLRRGIEDGRAKFWIGLVVATSLAMYAHILAALLIPVEAALFILWWRMSRKHLRAGLIALALLTVPYIPLARWELPLIFQPAETGFAHYTFGAMLGALGNAYSLGILSPFNEWQIQVAISLSAALAVFGLLDSKFSISHRLSLLLWAVIPFSTIFIISINRPIFTDRYLIWIEAAYILLIAIAIFYFWGWHKPIGLIVLTGVCVIGAISLNAQATTPFKPDFRSAAHALAAEFKSDETIVFQIPYVHFNFDYYFHQPYKSIDGPYTNFPDGHGSYQESQATVFNNLDALFNNQHSIWLVLSEEDMWDQRHLLRQWLSAHGKVTYQAAFAQVEITRYQLNSP